MLFVELRFFAFFAVVFAAYWLLKSNAWRKAMLVAASYLFYGVWDWRFLGLILLVTFVCWAVGRAVDPDHANEKQRKAALTVGVVFSLALLGVFKYFNFFADSFVDFAKFAGLPANDVTLNLILPVGISFYTFQAISYMVDVYRGQIAAKRSMLDVTFYIAFFPQLVAGPIVRAADFIPQMDAVRRWADVNVRWCLTLFLIGFIKKACLSDNIAPYVDVIFSDPTAYTAASVVAGVFLYGVQIYCDFSGYSDMAIATAGLLGYKFLANFDAPYLSTNIQEFWRRWHISLSSWLRDYLYIPLGGNRNGAARRDFNLMTTMILGGLWHGASWTFVIWGALHGSALIIERTWNKLVARRVPKFGVLGPLLGMAVTLWWVHLAWIFFRAADVASALTIVRTYVTFASDGTAQLPIQAFGLLACLLLAHWIGHRMKATEILSRVPTPVFASGLGTAFAVAIAFVPTGYRPFIYFQF